MNVYTVEAYDDGDGTTARVLGVFSVSENAKDFAQVKAISMGVDVDVYAWGVDYVDDETCEGVREWIAGYSELTEDTAHRYPYGVTSDGALKTSEFFRESNYYERFGGV